MPSIDTAATAAREKLQEKCTNNSTAVKRRAFVFSAVASFDIIARLLLFGAVKDVVGGVEFHHFA